MNKIRRVGVPLSLIAVIVVSAAAYLRQLSKSPVWMLRYDLPRTEKPLFRSTEEYARLSSEIAAAHTGPTLSTLEWTHPQVDWDHAWATEDPWQSQWVFRSPDQAVALGHVSEFLTKLNAVYGLSDGHSFRMERLEKLAGYDASPLLYARRAFLWALSVILSLYAVLRISGLGTKS